MLNWGSVYLWRNFTMKYLDFSKPPSEVLNKEEKHDDGFYNNKGIY